jgi:hypothetical protein
VKTLQKKRQEQTGADDHKEALEKLDQDVPDLYKRKE